MYKTALNLKRLLLIGGDVLALQASLLATLWLRYGKFETLVWQQHRVPFFYVTGLWVVGLFVAGLYDLSKARNGLAFFRLFLEGMIVNLLVAFAFFYLIPVFGIEPRTNLLLYFAISLLFVYVWRLLYNRYVSRGLFRNRLLFIGSSEDALVICEMLKNRPLGFQVCAVIHTTPRASYAADGLRWDDRLSALEDMLARERISSIVLGHSLEALPELRDALYRTLFTSTAIIDRKELEETLTGRVPVASVTKAWFLENLRESEKTWYEAVKRAIDVLLAIPFGLVTLAITPLVALAIKLSSRGPVFYSQVRVGKGGQLIRIWKFRTMHADAEKDGPTFTASAKTDARLFWTGRIMRQLRIDELPQVWNVLKGDLSFIGPRPERPEFVGSLVERMPYYALRHLTRPGLTGWAQIQLLTPTTSLEDNLKKLQYDLYYIKHRSLILDLAILLKTIGIVLRRQGT
ncbi:hypothetical protein A3E39_01140 [Candidatus Uhrbacteria bacterium RIFCSPHIGHO2_12_FULL_60_25]|uniref:Bacterial sugar transferase domain-containing protein n=1 Tax=Candidatus Uhrbacteria bacterium RIFCSPHIGHO2_12_FULL_60_25 TaxID=1802399 RepID=A0A1F7UKF2_9BACT|nr:MAG: hypothetical protein A3D73_02345 [Candidatus Uhrbacteria bacterium RIFCSPHIGHO2_02_FULL_60_44]OGL78749.1 MAG: hypothetical protein A3E39_01140 [Candidatus Uhrbacteria bacterium RIFCSPHIGHO2_12_FULL_60_25]